MELTHLEYLEEILNSKDACDHLTGYQKIVIDALTELLSYCPYERLCELAQADQEGKIPKYTIGDTIYDRFGDAWEVRTAELHLLGEKPDWMYRCGHAGTDDYCALWSFEILTCEDAEAALRREQG